MSGRDNEQAHDKHHDAAQPMEMSGEHSSSSHSGASMHTADRLYEHERDDAIDGADVALAHPPPPARSPPRRSTHAARLQQQQQAVAHSNEATEEFVAKLTVAEQVAQASPSPSPTARVGAGAGASSSSSPAAAAVSAAPPALPFRWTSLMQCEWWRAQAAEVTHRAAGAWTALRVWSWALLRWLLLFIPLGALIGVASACFLWSIDRVTRWRFEQPWLLYLLPLSGALQGLLYKYFARVPPGMRSFGVDFIIEQVHMPDVRKGRAHVPMRMGWLAWLGTCMSHLNGASVGREGTGLQLAASIAHSFAWAVRRGSCGRIRLGRHTSRLITVAAMAAGFSGVFGTPFAAVVFSIEVLSVGSIASDAFIPCLIASCASDVVSALVMEHMGLTHSHYPHTQNEASHLRIHMLFIVALASAAFGLIARAFSEGIHLLQRGYRSFIPHALSGVAMVITPVVGGLLVILLTFAIHTRDYLGIGTILPSGDSDAVVISSCFSADGACHTYSFAAKSLFTVVSLAAGFKGGEVTCLFYIGASAGYTAAQWLGVPGDTHLLAATGFVSVFGAAANTPLASTLMACELFGGTHVVYYAIGCYVAFVVSGNSGIYKTQKQQMYKMAVRPQPGEEEKQRADNSHAAAAAQHV